MSAKILIIDDDPHIGEALKLYLEKEGHEIQNAYDGVEGMALFKEAADILLGKRKRKRESRVWDFGKRQTRGRRQ